MTTPAARAPNAAAGATAGAGFDALMAALFPPGQLPLDSGAQALSAAAQPGNLTADADSEDAGATSEARANGLDGGEATASDLRLADAVPLPPAPQPATSTPADTGADAAARAPAPPAPAAAAWQADALAVAAGEPAARGEPDALTAPAQTAPADASASGVAPAITPTIAPRTAPADAVPPQAAGRAATAPAAAPPQVPAQAPPITGNAQPAVATAEPSTAPAVQAPATTPDATIPNAALAGAQTATQPETTTPSRASRADRRAAIDEAAPAPATREGVKAAAEKAAAKADAPPPAETAVPDATSQDAGSQDAGPFLDPSETAPAVGSRAATHTDATPSATATPAPVRGSPETVANLAAQIAKKLEGRSTRFDVELNPEGLGKVDVRVEIGAHGRLTAALVFDSAQAAQDLKARAADLQRALEQAGFDVAGGLSFDVAQDQGGGRQAWQDARSEFGETVRGRAFRAALETAGDAADIATQGALKLRRGVNAGLDLRI
ncbi:flagellar hook-length control protein FliK [Phenylobacterium sp.]|uniref:flagellar hook-length control protein FliK n=1 Tax=Phenylobacterium sp. TaxID=1871053 RepID=UPI00301DDF70